MDDTAEPKLARVGQLSELVSHAGQLVDEFVHAMNWHRDPRVDGRGGGIRMVVARRKVEIDHVYPTMTSQAVASKYSSRPVATPTRISCSTGIFCVMTGYTRLLCLGLRILSHRGPQDLSHHPGSARLARASRKAGRNRRIASSQTSSAGTWAVSRTSPSVAFGRARLRASSTMDRE